MIEIKTYKTTDSTNALNKVLSETGDYEGVLNAEFNILRPIIRFRANAPVTFNYAYIPQLQRYYFVDNVKQDGNLCIVALKVDVLQTYKNYLVGKTFDVVTTNEGNNYLSSNEYIYNVKPKLKRVYFPNGKISGNTKVMITIKGDK